MSSERQHVPVAAGRQPPASSGRVRQRRRTHRALLQAAKELIEAGGTPTVAEVADAAEVSRATAYRYFPSQEALLAEAALPPGLPGPDELFARPDAPIDAEERVVLVQRVLHTHITAREPQFRHFLRTQLLRGLQQPGTGPDRPAFRILLLDAALEPLASELPRGALERLRDRLGLVIGTEGIIAGRDVMHLDQETTAAHVEWVCRALVRAALAEHRKPVPE